MLFRSTSCHQISRFAARGTFSARRDKIPLSIIRESSESPPNHAVNACRAAAEYPREVPLSLASADWRALEQQHQERADALSLGRRQRVERGETHPVNDFLFTYYPLRPGLLRRWHPGAGIVLADAAGDDRAGWKWYHSADTDHAGTDLEVDTADRKSVV